MFATLLESPLVVLDAVDILDMAGKNALLRYIKADSNRHYLLCMMVSAKDKAPKASALGIKNSYYIENGRITEV
jgi:hypothetical protein